MDTQVYEFRVDGQISEQAREALCDMRIEEHPGGATLFCAVIDESPTCSGSWLSSGR